MAYYYFFVIIIVTTFEFSHDLFIQIGCLIALVTMFLGKTILDDWGRTN